MARRKKRGKKRDQAKPPEGCPLGKKTPKVPLVERTDTRGLVELKFPGFEATFPGTNRSIMVIVCTGICALVIIVPVCFYQVFSADPEALETVGSIFGGDEKPREPVKMQVQTDDGIEIIEVCPPCQDWNLDQCEEHFGQCGAGCPQCPQCQVCPLPAPPAMTAPQKGDDPLL